MLFLMSSRCNGVYFKVFFSSFRWQFSTQGQLFSKSVILLLSLSKILASTLLALTSGGKDDPSNYGTIALLPTSSKILEKAIHTQLNSYLYDNQLLTTNQYGFRLNCSSDCHSEVHSNVLKSMDDGELTGVIFLDLAKASDTVNHKDLITQAVFSWRRCLCM